MSWCRIVSALTVVVAVTACSSSADEFPGPVRTGNQGYQEHSESEDFQPVVVESSGKSDETSSTFNKNSIISDDFFEDGQLTTAEVQAFLEKTPYGELRRSWLADEVVGGRSAAELLVESARAVSINPMMLLVRMQVEQGLVSKSQRPSQSRVDRALGCGCFDGQSCQSRFLGLKNQLRCGAETMKKLYDGSRNGSAEWRKGVAKTTLDPLSVRPKTHATAAMYAYTPWVLKGRGGNWLVWNITHKYYKHLRDHNLAALPAFVGTVCEGHSTCSFAHEGQAAECLSSTASSGFCTLRCAGACPDRTGFATTFCVRLEGAAFGTCLAKSSSLNARCGAIPGTSPRFVERYLGSSSASPASATVCYPD